MTELFRLATEDYATLRAEGVERPAVMEDHEQQYDPEKPALLIENDQGYFEELCHCCCPSLLVR